MFAFVAPAPAQEAPAPASGRARPAPVDAARMLQQADALRALAGNLGVSEGRLKDEAAAQFRDVQSETPIAAPIWTPVPRERVDGSPGDIDAMLQTADQRFADYRNRFKTDPPPDVVYSAKMAAALREQKRESFDKTGLMPDAEMGVFRYGKASLEGGVIALNQKLRLIATRVGQAFSFATLVHEATHARDREAGRLDPQHEIDAEINAFRVEYLWLVTMDPDGMKLIVLRSSLKLWLDSHPLDSVTAQSIGYLDHLIDIWSTGGDKDKLRALVQKLGYEDDPDRPAPAPTAPAPARA